MLNNILGFFKIYSLVILVGLLIQTLYFYKKSHFRDKSWLIGFFVIIPIFITVFLSTVY